MIKNSRRKLPALLAATAILSYIPALAQQSARASVDDAAVRAAHPSTGLPSNAALSTPGAARGLNRPNSRPAPRQRASLTEAELLSGVNLTDEQKSTIDRIHHDMRAKMEIVSKDQNESPEQKSAMLEGMNRIQLRQVFDVLHPEQRDEVRKKIAAMRTAEHQRQRTDQTSSQHTAR